MENEIKTELIKLHEQKPSKLKRAFFIQYAESGVSNFINEYEIYLNIYDLLYLQEIEDYDLKEVHFLNEINSLLGCETDVKNKVKVNFILKKLIELKGKINKNEKESSNSNFFNSKNLKEIKFNLTQIELTELVKALIENGNVKGKQKEIINAFSSFFEIEIRNQGKTINDLKKRNNGSETLFLDKLKATLNDYINE